jgi:uncharacterized iron-regulated membrane protein
MAYRNRKIQQALRKLHLWVGLVAGAFIAMMALTGMIIIFRPALESAAAPRTRSGGAPANLTAMEQSFAANYPGASIAHVTIPDNPPGLLLVQAETDNRQQVQAYFDAVSGQDLGPKKTLSWLDWITDLHQNLLMGKRGRAATGVIGFALIFIASTGILSWLAGPRVWKRGLAVPQKGQWRRVNYEWHRWSGLWANVLLLAVSLTGIVLAYPDAFQRVVGRMAGERQPPPEQRRLGADRKSAKRALPLDDYVQAAAAAIPGGVVRELKMPKPDRGEVSIQLWTPGDIRPNGDSVVLLTSATARVLSVDRSSDAPLSRKLAALANAIHKTELGGLPVKLVWSMLGFVPVLLFLSGLQIWWTREQSVLRHNQARKENPAVPVRAQAGS